MTAPVPERFRSIPFLRHNLAALVQLRAVLNQSPKHTDLRQAARNPFSDTCTDTARG